MRLFDRLQWHGNRFLRRHLWLLDFVGVRLTVTDQFSTPGDTLMSANVCRIIKERNPKIRLNLVTKNPDLVLHDPALTEINGPRGFFQLAFEYLGLMEARASSPNALAPCFSSVGIRDYDYRARVYLTPYEIETARRRLPATPARILAINVMSKELVKVWSLDRWEELIRKLSADFTIIQLGDHTEPAFADVLAFGGRLTKRESMALLSLASLHIGPDSFLMHAANGLDVPSVIIYGGARPPGCFGYAENENLYVPIECSPCWLHTTVGESCPIAMECMKRISVDDVLQACRRLLSRPSNPHLSLSTSCRAA